jgi:hypothetical protein
MAAFILRQFSRPETLRTIDRKRLIRFLLPFSEFLQSRGLSLPQATSDIDIHYESLAELFMTPSEATPKDLIDALYFVNEMATDDGMDALIAEAKARNAKLKFQANQTAADIAVQIWLLDKDILERKHAEHHLENVRSFESFQAICDRLPKFKLLTEKKLKLLEDGLGKWFSGRNRGRNVRVIVCQRSHSVWFLIRHGEPFKREESINGGKSSCVCYRPVKYDVVTFLPLTGELRINARSKGEKQVYCAQFGKHLFGDEQLFAGIEKYTLDPLRNDESDSLAVGGIENFDWIRLREVQILYGGNAWELVTHKSNDLFALLESRGQRFPQHGRIVRATFQVKFADAKTPRSVVIKPSNVAQFSRDDDSLIVEQWLTARGFSITEGTREDVQPEQVLDGHRVIARSRRG